MKVSVIFEDGVIVVDRVSRAKFTFNVDANWRALQWDNNRGWIEVTQGERIWITDLAAVQPYIDMYNAAVPGTGDPNQVPSNITQRQFRLQLRAMGRSTAFRNYVNNADEPTQIYFMYEQFIQRSAPEIQAMATNFNLTPVQVDNLFRAAALIL